jgi:hypothetical protein
MGGPTESGKISCHRISNAVQDESSTWALAWDEIWWIASALAVIVQAE